MDEQKLIAAADMALRHINNTRVVGIQNAGSLVNAYNAVLFIKQELQKKESADEVPTSERGQQE